MHHGFETTEEYCSSLHFDKILSSKKCSRNLTLSQSKNDLTHILHTLFLFLFRPIIQSGQRLSKLYHCAKASKQHLAREDASHVFLGTNQPSLNTYFSWRALYSDDTFDSSRHKRRTSTRPGEDNQDVTQ